MHNSKERQGSCWRQKPHGDLVLVVDRSYFEVSPGVTFAKSLQLCPTLRDPIDGSPPGYLVPGTLQARTLEWVVLPFSNA